MVGWVRGIALGLMMWTVGGGPASGDVYYDVDFEAPDHTVDVAPSVTGSEAPYPRTSPSEILLPWLGSDGPIVRARPSAGQWLEFQWAGPPDPPLLAGEHLAFDVWNSSQALRLRLELQIESLAGAGGGSAGSLFQVIFDTPTSVHGLEFKSTGSYRVYYSGFSATLGSYATGVPIQIEMLADPSAQTWQVWTDGTLVHDGAFPGAAIENVRIVLTDWDVSGVPQVFLDDVCIATGDEPAGDAPCRASVNAPSGTILARALLALALVAVGVRARS